jgi:GGDEF domain-containing protein
MPYELSVDDLGGGLVRFAVGLPGGQLSAAVYLLRDAAGAVAVDAGPASGAAAVLAAVDRLAPLGALARLIILDAGPYAASAAADWRRAGFRGEIVAEWRTALGLAAAGVGGPFRQITARKAAVGGGGPSLDLFSVDGSGRLYAYCAASGDLFTGEAAAGMGPGLPAVADSGWESACAAYRRNFGAAEGLAAVLAACVPPPVRLRPRFGPGLPAAAAAALAAAAAAETAATAAAAPDALCCDDESETLRRAVGQLEADNLGLRSAMVTASDAALRDPVSGLYSRAYAEVFLGSILGQGGPFTAAFVEVDRLKDLNRAAGAAAGDRLLADVAAFLAERAVGAIQFRWAGPVFLLVYEAGREAAFRYADELRTLLAAERRFSRPATVSVALVGSDELPDSGGPEAALGALHAIARSRLKLLERRGGNETIAESGIAEASKTLALVLDGDPLAGDYLVEHLNRRGFAAVGARRGGEALELLNRFKPEAVVADAFLPQFDAFQLRERMLASPDLRRIPFVLLAEAKNDELVERALSLEIFHIFGKPAPLDELAGVLGFLVRRYDHGD